MYKTILTLLNGSGSDDAALRAGYTAGAPFKAHMECLRIRPGPAQLAFGVASMDVSGAVTAELFDALVEEDKARTECARKAFEEFRTGLSIAVADVPGKSDGLTIAWRERAGDVIDEAVAAGRVHDLVVLAGHAADSLSIHQTGSILLGCGRPVLLSGSQNPFATIAIAWKECAEAARAITAAMPLLESSHRIIVLTAIEAGDREGEVHESSATVERQLRWHGLTVESRFTSSSPPDAPGSVMQAAKHAGADLVVMGGYGHNRLRETVFGGFTRHVLHGAELPILMFH
jgi:nucleotide-binding universal stress UspA family protein